MSLNPNASDTSQRVLNDADQEKLWDKEEYGNPYELYALGDELFRRWRGGGITADLLASWLLLKEACQVLTAADRETFSIRVFHMRFRYADITNCLYESTMSESWEFLSLHLSAEVVATIPENHQAEKVIAFDLLATAYELRYQHHKVFGDLEDAIRASEAALSIIPLDGERWKLVAGNLANKLESRFTVRHDPGDIGRAIDLMKKIYEGAINYDNGLGRAHAGSNWAAKLLVRYQVFHGSEDLDVAIRLLQDVIEATPTGHYELPKRYANLSLAYLYRAREGEWEFSKIDLAAALQVGIKALATLNLTSPSRLSAIDRLTKICECKLEKAPDREDKLKASEEAIAWATELFSLIPRTNQGLINRSWVECLGKLYNLRIRKYAMSQNEEDKKIAESLLQELKKYVHVQKIPDSKGVAESKQNVKTDQGAESSQNVEPSLGAEHSQDAEPNADGKTGRDTQTPSKVNFNTDVKYGEAIQPSSSVKSSADGTIKSGVELEIRKKQPETPPQGQTELQLTVQGDSNLQAPAASETQTNDSSRVHDTSDANKQHLSDEINASGHNSIINNSREVDGGVGDNISPDSNDERWFTKVHIRSPLRPPQLTSYTSLFGFCATLINVNKDTIQGVDAQSKSRNDFLSSVAKSAFHRISDGNQEKGQDKYLDVALSSAAGLYLDGRKQYPEIEKVWRQILEKAFGEYLEAIFLEFGPEQIQEWLSGNSLNGYAYVEVFSIFATALVQKYAKSGNREYLELAIITGEGVVKFSVSDVTHHCAALCDLSIMYWTRSRLDSSIVAIERGIQLAEGALTLSLTSSELFTARIAALYALGNLLLARFQIGGIYNDLQMAIQRVSDGLILLFVEDPARPILMASLSILLQRSCDRNPSSLLDLEEPILFSRVALAAPSLPLNVELQLIQGLATEFDRKGEGLRRPDGLEKSIFLYEKLLESTPPDVTDWAWFAHGLSFSLRRRYEADPEAHTGDVQRAVALSKQVIKRSVPDDPRRARYLITLFNALEEFRKIDPNQSPDESLAVIKEAFQCEQSVTASERIVSAQIAAKLLVQQQRFAEAFEFLVKGIDLLPYLSTLWLDNTDKQAELARFSGLPGDAACVGLLLGKNPSEIIELLERGRGLILSSVIDCRNDISQLRSVDPALYEELDKLRSRLNKPLAENLKLFTLNSNNVEDSRNMRQRDFEEMSRLLSKIRKLPGLEWFQRSPPAEKLQEMAKPGPIVILLSSVHVQWSYAIIATESGINALQLPRMKYPDVEKNVSGLKKACTGSLRDFADRGQQMGCTLNWLWDVAVSPILEVVCPNTGGDCKDKRLPRLWWIGVGLLSKLPFHAAMASTYSSGASTMDRVISSYTPSIKTLMYGREQYHDFLDLPSIKFLAVNMEETPGHKKLDGINAEAERLKEAFQHAAKAAIMIRPNANTALTAIPNSNIVHFACHGESDPLNPSNSHLVLVKADSTGNERVDYLTVRELIENQAAQGGGSGAIAFLRACSTADNPAVQLADEVIHLVSAFQIAGFSHVLGTLWNTRNGSCEGVTRLFYERLLGGSGEGFGKGEGGGGEGGGEEGSHHRKVAEAFHEAVKGFREDEDNGENPLLWASFIHYGA